MAQKQFHLASPGRLRPFALGLCCFVVVALTVDSRSARSAALWASSEQSQPARAVTDHANELLHDAAIVSTPLVAVPAPRESSDSGPRTRTIWMEVTAYCGCKKCCGPRACGQTASGRTTVYNGGLFVAADTSLLPFETQLKIPGYAGGLPVEVIDRGRAIKGHRIDVFFATHEQATNWGRKWLPVTVVE